MQISRLVEYAFFFGLLGIAGYMVWQLVAPFVSALALAAIIVTICYPLHNLLIGYMPKRNRSLAALVSTMVVWVVIILPLILISALIAREVVAFYQGIVTGEELSVAVVKNSIEQAVQIYIPDYTLDLSDQLSQSTQWFAGNLGAIFAGTFSTIITFVLAMVGSFYFFRDGKELLQLVISASPLTDHEDHVIFDRLARAIRAVATGTLLVALIQGTLAAIGFTLFGIDRAILWGSLAAVGALVPGIGTSVVTLPAVAYLFLVAGDITNALLLLIWSVTIVGLVDNFIGPYLIGRGSNMHPFVILIAVLGGISVFGPLGFVIGPVVVTLFFVLLEIYNQHIVHSEPLTFTGQKRKKP
jgi:predicted PurR-regulated permease PerM